MADRFICRYREDVDTIEADSMIEAIMQYLREYDQFPEEVVVEDSIQGTNENYKAEIRVMQALLNKRTEERDYAVQKLHDVFHAVKEAMATE